MMEENVEGVGERSLSTNTILCHLCCQNHSLSQRSSTSSKTGFTSFFKDVDVTDDNSKKAEVDLCLSCRNLLTPAVEVHEKAMETEVRVGQLQREILKEMRTLQGQLCQFYVEMNKVREVIAKFPKGEEGQAKAEANLILKKTIIGVVRDLQLYNTDLSPKIILYKIQPNDHDHEQGESGVDEAHIDDVNDSQSEEFDADADLEFESMDMEMKSEPCEIGGDVEVELAGVVDKEFSEAEQTEVKHEHEHKQSKQCAVAAVKAKAKSRRGKTKWSRASKYAKDKRKTYLLRIPKPTPKDDEWLPESEDKELIPRRKTSESPPPKIKIQAIKATKGMSSFKKSVIARIISTKGVTIHRFTIRKTDSPSLFKPFQQNPMKYDSSTDTISVGDIPVIIDEKKKSLKCSSCALEFRNCKSRVTVTAEFLMHEHILGHHLQTMKCPVCDKVMRKINSFINHLLCHQGHNPCDICGRPFYEKTKMIRHKVTHMNASERADANSRGEGKTSFDIYLSKNEKKLSEEVISTLKEIMGNEETSDWKRNILCRVIKEGAKQIDKDKDRPATKFPISYDQATDKLSVSGIEIIINETESCLECSSCSVKLHGKNLLQRVELSMQNHILSKHLDAFRCPFPAEQCTSSTRSFETLLKYNHHLKYHHPKEGHEQAVCEICGKIFKSSSRLNSHRAFHYKEKHIRKPKSTMKLNLPLKHKCSTCGKGFWSRVQLRRHEVSHLPPEQRKSFFCNRCGKKFHLVYHLNYHQKVTCFEKGHEPPRVPCQFCSRTLKNNQQLQKHIATMHPEQNLGDERPFQCSMCPQRFKTEWSVEGHERMKHAVTEGGTENGNGNPESGYRCRKGCGKLIATAHGRNVHESYCDGEGCKTERERSKSKKK